jgi:hypothetical protein
MQILYHLSHSTSPYRSYFKYVPLSLNLYTCLLYSPFLSTEKGNKITYFLLLGPQI